MHVIVTGASSGLGAAMAALAPTPGMSYYNASKGLESYDSSMALSMQPQGTPEGLAVRVSRAVTRRKDRVIYPAVNTAARRFPALTRWMMDRMTPPLKG